MRSSWRPLCPWSGWKPGSWRRRMLTLPLATATTNPHSSCPTRWCNRHHCADWTRHGSCCMSYSWQPDATRSASNCVSCCATFALTVTFNGATLRNSGLFLELQCVFVQGNQRDVWKSGRSWSLSVFFFHYRKYFVLIYLYFINLYWYITVSDCEIILLLDHFQDVQPARCWWGKNYYPVYMRHIKVK